MSFEWVWYVAVGREGCIPMFNVSDGEAGKYEWEYQASHEEHHIPIASPPFGQAAQTSQLYGEMRNEAVQATGLEGIPSTLDIGGRDRNGEMDHSQNQQSNTWNYSTSSIALANTLDASKKASLAGS
jgi:hypothetical protein